MLLLLATACTAAAPSVAAPEPAACGVLGMSQACSCGAVLGVQHCSELGWSPCVCASPRADDAGRVELPAPALEPQPAAAADAPTGVMFDWPETDPDAPAAVSCKPGHYSGTFSCRLYIITMEGDGAFELSGSVELNLEQTSSGELLRIRDGRYASTSAAVIPATADIVGELDCARSRFTGRLENGLFSVALGLDVPFTQGTFSGPLQADYDKVSAAMIQGTWSMVGELDGFPGSCPDGKWSASWTGD